MILAVQVNDIDVLNSEIDSLKEAIKLARSRKDAIQEFFLFQVIGLLMGESGALSAKLKSPPDQFCCPLSGSIMKVIPETQT